MIRQQPETESTGTTPLYNDQLIERYGDEAVEATRDEVRAMIDELGEPAKAVAVGATAPDFTLSDADGTQIALADLLAQGPAVVIFYRGGWCPFCNVYLRALQLARMQLRALKAQVVLISPQLPAYAQQMADRQQLLFPLLSDHANQVARRYGLVFRMPDELREWYLEEGTDLAVINSDGSWEVPMPATFVIDQGGIVQYAFVSADYTQRAEPNEILAVLQKLKRSR